MDRAERERAAYDKGLDRTTYNRVLGSPVRPLYERQRIHLAHAALREIGPARILEIGRSMWLRHFDVPDATRPEVICINISQRELDKGVEAARSAENPPTFLLMDAHSLSFPDGYFDAVGGLGILHHLELDRALSEIARVLRPGGKFMFSEPLDNNPVGRLVRRLTPHARTSDEKPLRQDDLAKVRRHFQCQMHYEQGPSVPIGVAANLLRRGGHRLSTSAYHADQLLLKLVPSVGPLYRHVTIIGTKPFP